MGNAAARHGRLQQVRQSSWHPLNIECT
jgi:hypothetical protein